MVLLFSSFISCIVVISIIFQFLDDRNVRIYRNKYLYQIAGAACVIIIMLVNLYLNAFLNILVNALCVGAVSYFLYDEYEAKRVVRIMEAEALLIITGVVEALGVYLIDYLLSILDFTIASNEIMQSIETVFSKTFIIFFYYVILRRIWKKSIVKTRMHYILYLTIFIYSIINVLVVSMISSQNNSFFLIILMAFTMFTDLFLLFFIQYTDEKNDYKLQLEMMKQQEILQYENFTRQEEKNNQLIGIVHDVEKHIKIIESLYRAGDSREAISYTNEIRTLLKPLVPVSYSNHAVFNCLLSDKKRIAEAMNIEFTIEVTAVDLHFMEPIHITTLFGNLLDNAIAAAKNCRNRKYIGLSVKEQRNMLIVRIENSSSEEVVIKGNRIVYFKKHANEKKGIGILNMVRCVDHYEGNLVYKHAEDLIVCDIILNRT